MWVTGREKGCIPCGGAGERSTSIHSFLFFFLLLILKLCFQQKGRDLVVETLVKRTGAAKSGLVLVHVTGCP
jgi:hypothetical protein